MRADIPKDYSVVLIVKRKAIADVNPAFPHTWHTPHAFDAQRGMVGVLSEQQKCFACLDLNLAG